MTDPVRRTLVWIVLGVVLVLGALFVFLLEPRAPDANVMRTPVAESPGAVEYTATTSTGRDADPLVSDLDPASGDERDRAAAPAPAAVSVDPNTPGVLTVVVVAKETGEPLAKLSVQVVDPNAPRLEAGKVSRGQQIEAAETGRLGETVFTTTSGRIAFEVPPGRVLAASIWSGNWLVRGDKQSVPPLAPGERREVRFELLTRDDGVFCGLVLDRETRAPVANATITGGPAGKPPGEVARSDADGRFRMTFASWRFFEVEIAAPGYSLQTLWPDDSAPTPEQPFLIELARSASLVVTLRGYVPTDGVRPVLVASTPRYELAHELQRRNPKSYSNAERVWSAEFDAALRAELDDLPCRVDLTLVAREGERELHRPLETIELAPRERRELVWEFDAGCKLTVKALDADGRPQPNVKLWLLDDELGALYLSSSDAPDPARRGTTDASGVVVFESVAPRVWRVGPAQPLGTASSAFAPVAHVFTLAPGVREQTIELRLERALYIRGVVLDPDGKPRKSAVSANGARGALQGSMDTSADGTFVVGPLSAGPHRLRAYGSGDTRESEEVEVDAGAAGVELRLQRAVKLRGRVVHAANGGTCAASLVCAPLGLARAKWTTGSTGPDGAFEFGGLAPGIYGVSAISKDGRAGVLSGIDLALDRETPEVVVRVAPGAQLRVRFEASEGSLGVTATCDGVRVATDSVRAGGSLILRAPAGTVHLVFSRGNLNPWQAEDITLSAGEERELVLH